MDEMNEKLLDAVEHQKVDEVRFYLMSGADPNYYRGEGTCDGHLKHIGRTKAGQVR